MVREVFVQSVLNKHRRRDPWFLDDYSLNPYKLCSFNCIYCYIRGSKYGLNMGEELSVKVNAPIVLSRELRRRAERKEYGFIALSSATEPWQVLEEKYMVTRKCLEVISRYKFPVHCLTKSKLILRDLDLLTEIDKKAVLPSDLRKLERGVLITFSLSTLEKKIAEVFEPGAPPPEERLKTLQRVKEEGLRAGIAFIPVLPYISDSEDSLEDMVKTAKDCNADYVFIGALTLCGAGKKLFYKVLEEKFPELLPKYRGLFRSSYELNRGYQKKLEKVAKKLCEKYGVNYGLSVG